MNNEPNTTLDTAEVAKTLAGLKKPYLSGRPFLVITVLNRPKGGIVTSTKGWAKDPENWDKLEQHAVVDRVKSGTMARATVVIDTMNGAVVKNRTMGVSDKDVLDHYLTKYKEQVKDAMEIWLSRESAKKARAAA